MFFCSRRKTTLRNFAEAFYVFLGERVETLSGKTLGSNRLGKTKIALSRYAAKVAVSHETSTHLLRARKSYSEAR